MHKLKQEQLLPVSLDKAWDFFATPLNLNKVTPHDMVFKITSDLPDKMYEGLIISYKVVPIAYLTLKWYTEITHIKEKLFFVDSQIKGPFNIFHHEHHFKQVEGGVLMTDILHYDIGKWVFGWLAGKMFVHKRMQDIFKFRYQALENWANSSK